jgi:hypothetical protein
MRPRNRAPLIGILFIISIAVRSYGCGGTSRGETSYEIKESHDLGGEVVFAGNGNFSASGLEVEPLAP